MVSRANYVVITAIMIVVLVLFQFTGISENVVLRDGENVSVDSAVSRGEATVKKAQYEQVIKSLTEADGAAQVGLVGDGEACLKVGQEWCMNQKKTYCFYDSLQKAAEDPDCPELLLADGSLLESKAAEKAIVQLGKSNRSVIFSGLPDMKKVQRYPDTMKSLGIQEVLEEAVELDGFKLFAGLLLGGETVYKEYPHTLPFVKLSESVHVFAVGQSDEAWFNQLENEELPALIWRNYNGAGRVYVVNADFLEEKMGTGILTGLAADIEPAYMYPIVNAQISVIENYPMLSDENKSVMEKEYGQDSVAMVRDIFWPVIAGIYYDTDEKMTAMIAPRLDYSEDGEMEEDLVKYFYKQVTKMQGELGISGEQMSDIPLEEKLKQDLKILSEELPNYEIRTFYAGDKKHEEYRELLKEGKLLEDIYTVLKDYSGKLEEPLFSFAEGNTLELMLYMDSSRHSDEDDFQLRCLQTAYGYYATSVDAARAIYPESEDDLWNQLTQDWAKYYRPYRIIFEYFEKLTTTAADKRVRDYLALDYEYTLKNDTITLQTDAEEVQNYFILKTQGEGIRQISGADYEELEKDWYLITANSPEVTIKLEQTNRSVYD